MEESRNRKRPFNAIASEEGGGSNDADTGDVVDLVAEEEKIPPNQKRTHADVEVEGCSDNNTTHSIPQTGTGDANDGDCDSDGGEDEEETPVIRDLQKALEYLLSERNIESVYNNGNGRQLQQQQQKRADEDVEIIHPNITETNGHNHQHDEQLNKIPNLVNRILLEHYSSNNNNHAPIIDANETSNNNDANPNNMPRTQREKMTQLLIAVIVEFAEPYYAKMTRYRQQERQRLLLLQQQKQKEDKQKKKRAKKQQKQLQQQGQNNNAPPQDNNISSAFKFEERAASWATSCLKQLLQPPLPIPSSSSIPNNTGSCDKTNDHEDDPRIPELDALLAASGAHDGMKMEEQIQSALMHGVQSRRLLKSMGM